MGKFSEWGNSVDNILHSMRNRFFKEKIEPALAKELPLGIIFPEGLEKYTFEDYLDDVKEHVNSKNDKNKSININPFTNHEYALESALLAMASEKPRIVIVGSAGIDKLSMAQNLAGLIVNGNGHSSSDYNKIYSLENISSLIDQAKKKSKDNFYSYMFLPNLFTPFEVCTISYTSHSQLLKEKNIVEEYLRDIIEGIEDTRDLILNYSKASIDLETPEKKSKEDKRKKRKEMLDFKEKSLDDLVKNLEEIKSSSMKKADKMHDNLKKWIDDVFKYFTDEKHAIGYWIEDAVKKSRPKEKAPIAIWYGQEKIDINEVMDPHYVNPNSSGEKISVITNYKKDVFATFSAKDRFFPHSDITNSGKWFKGSVRIIPNFNDFLQLVTDVDSEHYSKPILLHGLQTGTYPINHEGETFNLDSHGTIIAIENTKIDFDGRGDPFEVYDPFIVIKIGGIEANEVGFRQEIKQIDLLSKIYNTKDVRKKTLAIMDSYIEKFNELNKLDMKISDDGYNALLKSMAETNKLINAEYGILDDKIQELGLFAHRNKSNTIDKNIIVKKKAADLPSDFFHKIDTEIRQGRLLDRPEWEAGVVSGISVYANGHTELARVKATVYPRNQSEKENIVQLVDPKHNMGDESTSKGGELASDALNIVFYKYLKGKKLPALYIKSDFKDEWDPLTGGPSASMAKWISEVSAVTQRKLRQTMTITGTVDSSTMESGKIGEVYNKSLSAMRLSEIDPQHRRWHFMFPAGNIDDLTKGLELDPFNVTGKITLLPVISLAHAYHYMSKPGPLTYNDVKYGHQMGERTLTQDLEKVYHELSRLYK